MKRRLLLGAVAVAAVAALAVFLLGRGTEPPADGAASLVPSRALAYLHLSTDPDRGRDEQFLRVMGRFPTLRALAGRVEQAIGAFEYERDVRPWLGKEAALALLDSGSTAADTLLLLSVRDEPKAQGLLARAAGADRGVEYKGVVLRRLGGVTAAFVGGFLALGQERVVKQAVDLRGTQGAGSLARNDAYAGVTLPEERVLDLWAPEPGVRRVLGAQAGLLGTLGRALQAPSLRSVHVSAAPEDRGLRVWVRRRLRTAPATAPFEPTLLATAPEDAIAFLGLGGLGALAPFLERLQARLPEESEIDLRRDLLGALRGEVALWVAPGLPVPTVTLVARTRDDRRAREALGKLLGGLALALTPPEQQEAGQVPALEQRRVGDVDASVLTVGPGVQLLGAVRGGRLVLTTAELGIERAARSEGGLAGTERFERAVGELPERAEALAFSDLSQLLSLGEQLGLASGTPVEGAAGDLRRIRTGGVSAQRDGNDTTAEFFFEIP